MTRHTGVEWPEIEKQIDAIASSIAADNLVVHCIVAVLRGGMVPARLLVDRLPYRPDLLTVEIKAYAAAGVATGEPTLVRPIRERLDGRTVLAVDDIADSGRTLDLLRAHLASLGASRMIAATLYRKSGSSATPDYFAAVAAPDEWIVFPWESCEFEKDVPVRSSAAR
jgi:hypoxanthine phosphoribosyltransferase